MAWQGMKTYRRDVFGRIISDVPSVPSVPSEAWRKEQADRQRSNEIQSRIDARNKEEEIRVAKILDQIKTAHSRPELIKIAAHDQNANIREAALLRLEQIQPRKEE